jgi:hypothetical protein
LGEGGSVFGVGGGFGVGGAFLLLLLLLAAIAALAAAWAVKQLRKGLLQRGPRQGAV